MRLLRDYKNWVLSQRNIRVAGYQSDHFLKTFHRTYKLFEHIGFEQRGGAYLLYTRDERKTLIAQAQEVAA